jgi:hypothetical protein
VRFQQHREASCKVFFLQGTAPNKIHAILIETLGEYASSYSTLKNWVAQFKHGDFSTCASWTTQNSDHPTPEIIIDQIHELILENHHPDFS